MFGIPLMIGIVFTLVAAVMMITCVVNMNNAPDQQTYDSYHSWFTTFLISFLILACVVDPIIVALS